jgi:malate dehydrogenase (quinone)
MLNLLQRCFPDKMNSAAWQNKLKQMIPSYGESLPQNPELLQHVRAWTSEVLGLENVTAHQSDNV